MREFDSEGIGQLSAGADLRQLAEDLAVGYQFLADLTPAEATVAQLHAADRALVLALIADLPTSRLTRGVVW